MGKVLYALVMVLAFKSTYVWSSNQWDSESVYDSGDIVTHQGDVYISSHWSKGKEPERNNVSWDGWVYFKYDDIDEWSSERTYQSGKIVKHTQNYYMAKWWTKDEVPAKSDVWRELSDINKVLENHTKVKPRAGDKLWDIKTILGVDSDRNGIRDDFENAIENNYQDENIKKLILNGSLLWQKQLEVSLDRSIVFSPEVAEAMFNKMYNLERCFEHVKQENPGFEYPHLYFTDTLERAYHFRVGMDRIYDFDEKIDIDRIENPCVLFNYKGEVL